MVTTHRANDEQLAFQLFSVMSGLAALSLFAERGYQNEIHGIPVVLPMALGFAMAWKPSNTWLALAFWASYTCFMALGFPQDNTNQTLLFFVGTCMVVSAAMCMFSQRSLRLPVDLWFRRVMPVLRVITVVLYMWTIWHKLNLDFINPAVSCAPTLTAQLLGRFGLHPDIGSYATAAVVMTVLTEAALPIGLLFARTQRLTVVLGLGFHWLLGLAGYFGFSSTMITLLPLFLFPIAGRAFSGYQGRSPFAPVSRVAVNRSLLVIYVASMLMVKFAFHIDPGWLGLKSWYFVPFIALAAWWNNRAPTGQPFLSRDKAGKPVWWLVAHPDPLYAIALVHFINGASPYLGYKTEFSYAMYSDLRTEGGKTNHLIWKTPLALAKYQTDLVYVLDGSDPHLFGTLGGRPVPRYVLSRSVQAMAHDMNHRGIVVVMRDGEATRRIESAERDSALMAPPSFIESRLLRFRDIVPASRAFCPH